MFVCVVCVRMCVCERERERERRERSEKTKRTNPDLVQYIIQQVRQFLKQQPLATIISVSQNDNQNYCKDPAEMAVIQAVRTIFSFLFF